MHETLEYSALELAYEKCLHQTNAIYDEERVRALRVQVYILEDENDQLQEQLALDQDRIDELEQLSDGRQGELNAAYDSLDVAQSDLRLKAREIETLKVTEDSDTVKLPN